MATKPTYNLIADGTAGELITWNASGVSSVVGAGTSGQVLTSNGAGAAPTFQAAAGGVAAGNVVNSELYKYNTYTSTTAIIPYDNTIPQNTEGFQFFNQTYTMKDSSNKIIVALTCGLIVPNANAALTVALFENTTANAISSVAWGTNASVNSAVTIKAELTPAAATVDLKARIGSNAGNTVYLNGNSTGNRLSTSDGFYLHIMEVKV